MAMSPDLTFECRFNTLEHRSDLPAGAILTQIATSEVDAPKATCWTGQGTGQSYGGTSEGLVGPNPRFILCAGWLTLLPADGWNRPLHHRMFSDCFAVFVGQALENALRVGDDFTFSRRGDGYFAYTLARNDEVILTTGTAGKVDDGQSVAVWQERGEFPWPSTEAIVSQIRLLGIDGFNRQVSEWRDANTHVAVRVRDQVLQLHLLRGEEAQVDSYYVFLALTRQFVYMEARPRVVCAIGHLDALDKGLVMDAARRLIAPDTRLM